MSEDRAGVAPGWPFAFVALDGRSRQVPAIVLEWTLHRDQAGYPTWHARCLYWDGGEAHVESFPGGIAGVVSKASTPASR